MSTPRPIEPAQGPGRNRLFLAVALCCGLPLVLAVLGVGTVALGAVYKWVEPLLLGAVIVIWAGSKVHGHLTSPPGGCDEECG